MSASKSCESTESVGRIVLIMAEYSACATEKFDEEMAPYAIQTMSKLVEVFWTALEGNGEDEDDDGY